MKNLTFSPVRLGFGKFLSYMFPQIDLPLILLIPRSKIESFQTLYSLMISFSCNLIRLIGLCTDENLDFFFT